MAKLVAQKFYLTRNSNSEGQLSPAVEVWYRRPFRRKLSYGRGYIWLPSDPVEPVDLRSVELGLYGTFALDYCQRAFGTIPDTDLECVVAEQLRPADN